jgi:hypothetical protein
MALRLAWAEEARQEAEKRRAQREEALADARSRGEGAAAAPRHARRARSRTLPRRARHRVRGGCGASHPLAWHTSACFGAPPPRR